MEHSPREKNQEANRLSQLATIEYGTLSDTTEDNGTNAAAPEGAVLTIGATYALSLLAINTSGVPLLLGPLQGQIQEITAAKAGKLRGRPGDQESALPPYAPPPGLEGAVEHRGLPCRARAWGPRDPRRVLLKKEKKGWRTAPPCGFCPFDGGRRSHYGGVLSTCHERRKYFFIKDEELFSREMGEKNL
ncbi:hypothetical protein LIER_18804 [Lithospermum erythrorhizon]|uniref:Uncharacterized protein n=1 Tax=Lithospermum erythrorhizon TaxID=34254 RepID=A0AAV3QIH7_LITER